jgi:hypothetical protein
MAHPRCCLAYRIQHIREEQDADASLLHVYERLMALRLSKLISGRLVILFLSLCAEGVANTQRGQFGGEANTVAFSGKRNFDAGGI